MTNGLASSVTITAIKVRNVDSGPIFINLIGPPLFGAMSLPASLDTPVVVLPPGTVGVVWLDVRLADKGQVPAFVAHRLTIDAVDGVPASFFVIYGRAACGS